MFLRHALSNVEMFFVSPKIIATNSFMYATTIVMLYNIEENCLMLHLYDG